MIDTDLSFEYSEVNADINGHIESIKNPYKGVIRVDSVGKIIKESDIKHGDCHIVIGNKKY